jgi:hypothetical protein
VNRVLAPYRTSTDSRGPPGSTAALMKTAARPAGYVGTGAKSIVKRRGGIRTLDPPVTDNGFRDDFETIAICRDFWARPPASFASARCCARMLTRNPVDFRGLPQPIPFRKYDVIKCRARRPRNDARGAHRRAARGTLALLRVFVELRSALSTRSESWPPTSLRLAPIGPAAWIDDLDRLEDRAKALRCEFLLLESEHRTRAVKNRGHCLARRRAG